MSTSLAGGVMELLFASVIVIWFVFSISFRIVLCRVFLFMWVFSLVSVVLVRHIDGGRYRGTASCQF